MSIEIKLFLHAIALRDTHGHDVVQHDFFNHDGLTTDGIAEAFEEFAKKEKLSFFNFPPPSLNKEESVAGGFNEIRYNALLQSLEITEISFSLFQEYNDVFRLDSEYFGKEAIAVIEQLRNLGATPIKEIAFVTDGIDESLPFIDDGPVKILSAKHPKENYIDCSTFETISMDYHKSNPRTALGENDVLVSTVGTIGNSAVITKDLLPANSDRHVGIIRLKRNGCSPYLLSTFLLTRFGRVQTQRETTGNVQPNLFISKIDELLIPKFGQAFEEIIADTVKQAYDLRNDAGLFIAKAEQTLLRALGLENWQPPEPLTYTRTSQETFLADRFDAEYFYPAKKAAQDFLNAMKGQRVGDLFDSVRELWQPEFAAIDEQVRNYDLTDALNPFLDDAKLPTTRESIESTKKIIQKGDLVVSRLRSYLKEIAVVLDAGDIPMVCSTEFIVLRPKSNVLQVEALIIYLRSILPQTIFKWSQDGSNHPRFDERELLNLRIPDIFIQHEAEITEKVQMAIHFRRQARNLLNSAKRAVEIAIEDSELSALNFLQTKI